MLKTRLRLWRRLSTMFLATAMGFFALGSSVYAANGGNALTSYETLAEAQAAAAELNIQLTGEGAILLKNDNDALPLNKVTQKVTVFGAAAASLQGGTGQVITELTADGFSVNTTLITEATAATADAASVLGYSDFNRL